MVRTNLLNFKPTKLCALKSILMRPWIRCMTPNPECNSRNVISFNYLKQAPTNKLRDDRFLLFLCLVLVLKMVPYRWYLIPTVFEFTVNVLRIGHGRREFEVRVFEFVLIYCGFKYVFAKFWYEKTIKEGWIRICNMHPFDILFNMKHFCRPDHVTTNGVLRHTPPGIHCWFWKINQPTDK